MARQHHISFKNAYSYFTFTSVAPKGCTLNPRGSKSSSQEICGYISVMFSLKFIYIFNKKNNVLSKINVELLQYTTFLLHMTAKVKVK